MDRPELEGRASLLAQRVFKLCAVIRTRAGGREPANQLQAAASSAAANYRAAGRSRSTKEFVAKLGMVNGECDEAVYWLEFARNTDLATRSEASELLEEGVQLRAIFAASYATARRNHRSRLGAKRRSDR